MHPADPVAPIESRDPVAVYRRCVLKVRSGFAVLEERRALSVFELRTGTELHSWPRAPLDDDDGDRDDDDDGDDEPDDDADDHGEAAPKLLGHALADDAPRLALLWPRAVELHDLATGARATLDGVAAQCETLVAVGPDGRLYGEGEATGLAAFDAFSAGALHRSAGRLGFALGFNTLPHVQQLAFTGDGHAVTGTLSQYRAHLAYISVVGPGEVRHAEPIEVVRIALLPGAAQAVVLEAGFAGPKKLSLWSVVPRRRLERVRDLHLEDHASATTIEDLLVDPAGALVVAFTTDGRIRAIDPATGRATLLARVGAPIEAPLDGGAAADFGRGTLAVRGPRGVATFDLDSGAQTGTASRADAIHAVGAHLLALRGKHVELLDGTRVATLDVRALASAPGPDGLVIVQADRRARVIRLP